MYIITIRRNKNLHIADNKHYTSLTIAKKRAESLLRLYYEDNPIVYLCSVKAEEKLSAHSVVTTWEKA